MKFTFDGCGINDATDPYASRIATMTRRANRDGSGYMDRYRPHCELMALAPELADMLRDIVASMQVHAPRESIERALALLAKVPT